MQAYWLKKYHIDATYDALPVAPEQLELLLRTLPQKGFAGVNLTIPHKEVAINLVDEVDDLARRIGAVNTIVIRDGKLLGTNTDAYGFMENLKQQVKTAPGKVLVLGAGGSARAICTGLAAEGWNITITGRTRDKAELIATAIGGGKVKVVEWDKLNDAMQETELLVNTTPLGMKGQQPLALSLEALPASAMVYDIIYNPLMTLLLTEAKARGNPIITGLGMLLYQGQAAFEKWFGVRPEVTEELHHYMLEALT